MQRRKRIIFSLSSIFIIEKIINALCTITGLSPNWKYALKLDRKTVQEMYKSYFKEVEKLKEIIDNQGSQLMNAKISILQSGNIVHQKYNNNNR